jgi:hypothetical protein
MLDLCRLIFGIASDLLRSRVALEAEILVLRQQINVLRRANPKRLRFVSSVTPTRCRGWQDQRVGLCAFGARYTFGSAIIEKI